MGDMIEMDQKEKKFTREGDSIKSKSKNKAKRRKNEKNREHKSVREKDSEKHRDINKEKDQGFNEDRERKDTTEKKGDTDIVVAQVMEQQDSSTTTNIVDEEAKETEKRVEQAENLEKTCAQNPAGNTNDLGNIETEKQNKKKDKQSSIMSLDNKSDLFQKIIGIAFECEELESKRQVLHDKNNALTEKCKTLSAENATLVERIKEGEALYHAKIDEIGQLEAELTQRNEVINIIKADKSESAQEYKNALAAALKTYYTDFCELKEMGTSDDVGAAVIETFESVIKVLEKNGIAIEK